MSKNLLPYPASYREWHDMIVNVRKVFMLSNDSHQDLLCSAIQRSIEFKQNSAEHTLGLLLQAGMYTTEQPDKKLTEIAWKYEPKFKKEIDQAACITEIMKELRHSIVKYYHQTLDLYYAFTSNKASDLREIIHTFGSLFWKELPPFEEQRMSYYNGDGGKHLVGIVLPAINTIIEMDIEDMKKGLKPPHKFFDKTLVS